MDRLHLKATLVEYDALMLLFVHCGLIVSRRCRELLLSILRLLHELSEGQSLNFLKCRQVFFEDVDLTFGSHFDEDCLRLVLLQHADWRQLVCCTDHEHYFWWIILAFLCRVIHNEWHFLSSLADRSENSIVSLLTMDKRITVDKQCGQAQEHLAELHLVVRNHRRIKRELLQRLDCIIRIC